MLVSRWTNTPLDDIWENWSLDKLNATYEAVRGAMYVEALPALLASYATLKANGAKTEWEEFVPAALRPDPLARLALSEEALRDIALALEMGSIGSLEAARLVRLLGANGLKAIEERYGKSG